jgi:hypothetical protein
MGASLMTKTHTSTDPTELWGIHDDVHHTGRGYANAGRVGATERTRFKE